MRPYSYTRIFLSVFLASLVFSFSAFAQCPDVKSVSFTNTTGCSYTDGSITLGGLTPLTAYTVTYTQNGNPQAPVALTADNTGHLLVTTLSAGFYILNVTGPSGCTSTVPQTVNITDPKITISGLTVTNPSACGLTDGVIFISGLLPNTAYVINYTFNAAPQPPVNATADASGIAKLSNLASGAYVVSVTYNACNTAALNATLVDPTFTSAYDFGIAYGCAGDTVSFHNLSMNATSYKWDFGDGNTSTEKDPVHIYHAQGTYTVVLHTLNGACDKTSTHIINIEHGITPLFTMLRDSICERQSVALDATSSVNAYTYIWDFGDGHTDSTNTAVLYHQYVLPGTYNITLTVKDFVPCFQSITKKLFVAPFALQFDHPDTSVCIYEPMAITSFLRTGDYVGAVSYRWSSALDLLDSNSQNGYFYAADTAYHTYVLTATSAAPFGCIAKDTVRIFAQPHVHLFNVTPSQSIRYGTTIRLNADGAYHYNWQPGKTMDNPNIKDPIVQPTESTVYTLYAMNQYGGCRDTAQVKIDVSYDDVTIASAFTPNFDGKNDLFTVRNLGSARLLEFRVYNRWGQLVFNTTNPSPGWDGTFNGQVLDADTYYYVIHIALQNGTQKTYRGDVTLIR